MNSDKPSWNEPEPSWYGGHWKPSGSGRSPSRWTRATRWARFGLVALLVGLAGCASLGPSPYRPSLPARPVLDLPMPEPCAKDTGKLCYPSFEATRLVPLVEWALTLERELRAACRALGYRTCAGEGDP